MARGRETRTLSPHQIERLQKFKGASHDGAPHGYSVAQLRTAIDAKFSPETLKKALLGRPVWVLYHAYIVQWLDRFLPAPAAIRSGKDAAAGNGEPDEEPEAARTVRGSR